LAGNLVAGWVERRSDNVFNLLIARQMSAGRKLTRDIYPAIYGSVKNQRVTTETAGANVLIRLMLQRNPWRDQAGIVDVRQGFEESWSRQSKE